MKAAVEWYNSKVIELMTQREQGNIDVLEFRNQLDLLLAQAKEMEKEQICKFASDYVETQCSASFEGSVSVDMTTEEYYNLTFKSE
jgi:hypothetical protein